MKKFYTFLFVWLMIFVSSNNKANSQCASGFTQDTVRLTIGNCDYDVVVCFKCQVTYPGVVYIKSIIEVDSSCNNLLNISQIIDQAYSEISTGQFIYGNLCFDTHYDAPPCNEEGTSYKEFEMTYYYCWQVKLMYSFGQLVHQLLPCENSAECNVRIKFCKDVVNDQYVKIGYSYMDSPQNPSCTLDFFQITMPDEVNEVSECFLMHSIPCGISGE